MKDIDSKSHYLLGGQFWYPFQWLEINKERFIKYTNQFICTIHLFDMKYGAVMGRRKFES